MHNAHQNSPHLTPHREPHPPAAFDTLATIAVHTSATAASAGHLLDVTKSPQQCNKQLYDTPRICFTNHIYPIKRPNHYQSIPHVYVRPGQWRVRGPSASLFLSPANLTTIRLNLVHRQWRFKSERLSRNLLSLLQVLLLPWGIPTPRHTALSAMWHSWMRVPPHGRVDFTSSLLANSARTLFSHNTENNASRRKI